MRTRLSFANQSCLALNIRGNALLQINVGKISASPPPAGLPLVSNEFSQMLQTVRVYHRHGFRPFVQSIRGSRSIPIYTEDAVTFPKHGKPMGKANDMAHVCYAFSPGRDPRQSLSLPMNLRIYQVEKNVVTIVGTKKYLCGSDKNGIGIWRRQRKLLVDPLWFFFDQIT